VRRGERDIMLCLNIRSTLPRIGMHTQQPWVEEASVNPAKLSTEYVAPRSNIWPSGAKIDIDSYPSRHSYGAKKMKDLTAEFGQAGLSGVREGTSGRTQEAWDMIENGATKRAGNYVARQAWSHVAKEINRQRHIVVQAIPDPVITVTPSTMQGDIDTGKDEVTIQTYPTANVKAHPGKVEVYLQQKGDIRMWTTEGQYDIYA